MSSHLVLKNYFFSPYPLPPPTPPFWCQKGYKRVVKIEGFTMHRILQICLHPHVQCKWLRMCLELFTSCECVRYVLVEDETSAIM